MTCGCCEPAARLTPLRVENRPGLSALAYRVGTFSSFRETMLTELSRSPELSRLTTRASDDYAVTLLELWAAVADVLTFYQERYANEAFLRPARRRESVSRLARLIDYRLGPGAAAVTRLAFAVEAGKTVRVPTGARVQSVPGQDERPQIFETLAELAADARLNRVRALPAPVGANPLAKGRTEAYLEPGEAALAAAAALSPGDRFVLVETGSSGRVEELAVREVRTEEDRVVLAWEGSVQGSGWNVLSEAYAFSRTVRPFGHDAPATAMTPAAVATVPGGIQWTLSSTGYAHPAGTTLELDARYRDLEAGTRLLLSVGSGAKTLLTVTSVQEEQRSVGPRADTVTTLTVTPTVPTFDRRSALLYELRGPRIRFWGYEYPSRLEGRVAYVSGARRGDQVEVGRTIVRREFVAGTELAPQEIAPGRDALLVDEVGAAVTAAVERARVVGWDVVAGSTPDDATTVFELGLDEASAVRATPLLGAALPPAFPLTTQPGKLAVTIGDVGPVPVSIHVTFGAPADVWAASGTIADAIRAGSTAPEFTQAQVLVVDGALLVLPGVPDAPVRIEATDDDATSALELGLDPPRARTIAGLLSKPLAYALPLTDAAPKLALAIGPLGSRTAVLPRKPTSRPDAMGVLQAGIAAADPAPAFAHARVLHATDRLLVLPGVVHACQQEYLALDLVPEAEPSLDARTASVLANVVRASHGETVPEEVLGSGDASRPFQRFALKRGPVTHVDGASTLQVLVNGVRWHEAPSLFDRHPDEQVYVDRTEEDGTTSVAFGDGQSGARPPSGTGNVRATYRVGLGLEGRVGAGTLTTALDRPPGLAAVTNPRPAEGGADPEPVDEARTNAPRTVRTFGRAVSLRDFEDLVTEDGEVAKAQATWVWDGLERVIHLTVAGQAGGTFSPDGLQRLGARLRTARDPNRRLRLANYELVPVVIRASVVVEPNRRTGDVVAAAREAALAALAFDVTPLGRPVRLSDVVRAIADVPGVVAVDVDELRGRDAAGGPGDVPVAPARPDPATPGGVLPAQLATVANPAHDITVTGAGGLAA